MQTLKRLAYQCKLFHKKADTILLFFDQVNGIRLAIDCLMSRECLAQYSKEKVVEIMQDLQEALIRFVTFLIYKIYFIHKIKFHFIIGY